MVLWSFECNEGSVILTLPIVMVRTVKDTRPEDGSNPMIEVVSKDRYQLERFTFESKEKRSKAIQEYRNICESYRPITRAEQEVIIRDQVARSQQRVMPVGAPFLHGANITKA